MGAPTYQEIAILTLLVHYGVALAAADGSVVPGLALYLLVRSSIPVCRSSVCCLATGINELKLLLD